MTPALLGDGVNLPQLCAEDRPHRIRVEAHLNNDQLDGFGDLLDLPRRLNTARGVKTEYARTILDRKDTIGCSQFTSPFGPTDSALDRNLVAKRRAPPSPQGSGFVVSSGCRRTRTT
jgi:hypothetical protein